VLSASNGRPIPQGVALGWSSRTPSALVSEDAFVLRVVFAGNGSALANLETIEWKRFKNGYVYVYASRRVLG
jgi:hypothetical protein